MVSELERHLREADEDGKPVEAVVGEDVKAFAESWAQENRPPRELGKRVLIFAECFAVLVVVFATFTHLWYRTISFGVDLNVLLPVWTFAVAASGTLFPALTVLEHLKPRWKKHSAVVVVAVISVVVPWGLFVLAYGHRSATVFEWPWSATLASTLIALVVHGLRRRFVPAPRAFMWRRSR